MLRLANPFRLRSGKVWSEPSYFGRTKQLNLRLYIFKNANATLPSGVKKDFRPRFTLKLFGFSSTKPNDIAKEALRLAAQKLPVTTKFVVRRDYDMQNQNA